MPVTARSCWTRSRPKEQFAASIYAKQRQHKKYSPFSGGFTLPSKFQNHSAVNRLCCAPWRWWVNCTGLGKLAVRLNLSCWRVGCRTMGQLQSLPMCKFLPQTYQVTPCADVAACLLASAQIQQASALPGFARLQSGQTTGSCINTVHYQLVGT